MTGKNKDIMCNKKDKIRQIINETTNNDAKNEY